MAIEPRPSVSLSLDLCRKPLPSLPQPQPSSPTLTNPDMVLPDQFADNESLSSPPRQVRPPSPSYLVQQGRKSWQVNAPNATIKARRVSSARNMAAQRSRTPPQDEHEPVIRISPARRAQYSFSNAVQPTSPTVYTAGNLAPVEDDGRRLSATASSITSEDLYAMRIPGFPGLDDDTETLTDGELDGDGESPSERWRAGEQMEPPETEESAATLMRAELILANAKKRLNLFDQNLRGAREMVAPLTAANLKRAASMHAAYIQPVFYGRTGYNPREESDMRQQAARPLEVDAPGHYRVLSDTAVSPNQDSTYASLSNAPIPIKQFAPSWQSNLLRGTRSQEQLKSRSSTSGQLTPRALHALSPEPRLATLQETDTSRPATAPRTVTSRSSATSDLRDQMHDLKTRISSLKERAREDSLRRRSMQTLRQACPLVHSQGAPTRVDRSSVSSSVSPTFGRAPRFLPDNPSPPLTEDGEIVFDPRLGYAAVSPRQTSPGIDQMRVAPYARNTGVLTYGDDDDTTNASTNSPRSSTSLTKTTTALSEESESDSIYEDAVDVPTPSQRHEDREDAFDYNNFFLHSSLGTFSRPRGSSVSSTDSGETAKGPATFDQVPPTPETPETLREIERNLHARAMSTESLDSTISFATAQEALRSGRQTPASISEWRQSKPKDGHASAIGKTDVESRAGVAEQATAKVTSILRSRSRSSTRTPHASFPSIPPSPAAIAVSALTDPKARPLGLKDKALVFAVVESLKQLCEKMQADGGSGYPDPVLRKRLDNARGMLDGSLPPVV